MDDYIMRSIAEAGGNYDPDTGHYAHLEYTGCPTLQRAEQIEDALYRCGRYLHRKKVADIGVKCNIKQAADGTYKVEYYAINKAHTRAYMISRYGEDRSRWPYDPRRRNEKK